MGGEQGWKGSIAKAIPIEMVKR